jgi:protein-disulfide isomerase
MHYRQNGLYTRFLPMRRFVPLLFLMFAPAAMAQTPAPSPTLSSTLEKQVLEVIRRHPEVIVESVGKYQTEQRKVQRTAEIKEFLKNPLKVDISNAPVLGPADAAITLVEFSDFQCPFCVRSQEVLNVLKEKYKGKLRTAFLHFPLEQLHPQAKPAALAAWAAGQQGKFFEYHDRLFALQEKILPTSFELIAQELKLDLVRFNQDRNSPQAEARIKADMQIGTTLGVKSTPTFVLNGIPLEGAQPLDVFEEVIKLVLETKAKP